MHVFIKYFLILFLLSFSLKSIAQVETALQLYESKKYTEALVEWNKLLDGGAKGEILYYNIGNTYYRLHQYPEAILFYNKSLKWNPNNKDCNKNLKLAQKAAGIENFELPEFILFAWYHKLLMSIQSISWFCIGMACISLFLYFKFIRTNTFLIQRKTLFFSILLTIGICCIIFSIHRECIRQDKENVILMKPAKLFLSPETGSESKQELIPGQQLQIKDHLTGWCKVQTKEFDLGWVEENKIQRIVL